MRLNLFYFLFFKTRNLRYAGNLKYTALIIFSLILPGLALAQGSPNNNFPSEITVTSDAWSWVSPDSVRITAKLENTGKTALEAAQGLEKIHDSVKKAINQLAPSELIIKERGREFFGADGKQTPLSSAVATKATLHLGIETKDLSKTSEIIKLSIEAGANSITDVTYTVKDDTKNTLDAITAATEKAKDKASVLAKSLGVSLGSVINASITEEPIGQIIREQNQMGHDVSQYQDRDIHVYVTLQFAINR